MLCDFFRAVWIILKKDLRLWIREPINLTATFVPALGFLLIAALGSVTVGRSPIALVTLDHDARGRQMQQIFQDSDIFRVTNATPQQAEGLLKNVQVIAVITIPADFTQRVNAHEQTPIDVRINNLNLDFTGDIRRSVPDAITEFYQAQGNANVMKITVHEQDLRQQDIQLFQYTLVPITILILMMSGVVNSGLSTAREWELLTVKELLFAPVARSSIILGKVLAGFFTTLVLGVFLLLFGSLLGWLHIEGTYWLNALVIIALMALMGAGIGVAMGAVMQRLQPVIAMSLQVVLYLFFLSGGIGVLAFAQDWLQNLAAFVPLSYGRHALEMAVFYNSADQFGRDVAVLAGSSLVALTLGVFAMRQKVNMVS